jgi:hypothetical protein
MTPEQIARPRQARAESYPLAAGEPAMTAALIERLEKAALCSLCELPYRQFCGTGEMHYPDGSSRACPNWLKRMNEIAAPPPALKSRVKP